MRRYDLIKMGQRLADVRHKAGLSRKAVANAIFVSEMTIAHYERAECVPTLLNIVALAEYYGITLEWLCYGESEG